VPESCRSAYGQYRSCRLCAHPRRSRCLMLRSKADGPFRARLRPSPHPQGSTQLLKADIRSGLAEAGARVDHHRGTPEFGTAFGLLLGFARLIAMASHLHLDPTRSV
jgi:hypothetical protein